MIDLAGKFKVAQIEPQLVEIFQNQKEQPKLRAAALKGLGEIGVAKISKLVEAGMNDERQLVRTEARKILATLDPKSAAGILAKVLEEGSIEEKQRSLETLAKLKSDLADQVFMTWLHRLAEGNVPAEIRLDLRVAAAERDSSEVKQLLAVIDAKRNEAKEPVAKYEDSLVGGNADRGGRIFFEKTSASCIRCHKIDGKGGEVGPISPRLPRRTIDEHFSKPSRIRIAKLPKDLIPSFSC